MQLDGVMRETSAETKRRRDRLITTLAAPSSLYPPPVKRFRCLRLSFCIATLLSSLIANTQSARAEQWNLKGKTVEGKLSGVYGPIAHIVGKKSLHLVTLDSLDDASLDQVARYLAAQPKGKLWAESASPVAKELKSKLETLKDGKLVSFAPGNRAEPEFYVIYFSAHWCGPCRKVTPKLIKTYKSLKEVPGIADKIEVLFRSSDNSRQEQIGYVNEVGMPWLILKYSSGIDIIDKWKGNGIPCIAVINRNGDILFHSYRDGKYQGAEKPLADLRALLKQIEPTSPNYLLVRHRLAMREQLLAGATQPLPAKLYLSSIDGNRYHGLDVPTIQVRIQVNEKGLVDSFVAEPALPAIYEQQLRADLSKWLFLPAVENGKFCSQELTLPVKF